jgi:hypothetical protein
VAKQTYMTEIEWSACSEVYPMLLALRSKRSPRKWSTRKARLFAVACCRRVWHLLDSPADRRAVEVAEEMADKKKKLTDLRVSHDAASTIDLGRDPEPMTGGGWGYKDIPKWDDSTGLWVSPKGRRVCRVARWASTPTPWGDPEATANDARVLLFFRAGLNAAKSEEQVQCGLLRDIAGPPARRGRAWLNGEWGTVQGVAESIYEGRAFGRLPILADALEDAGCTDAELLGHLRSPGPHVRGCWAVDLVLGKS